MRRPDSLAEVARWTDDRRAFSFHLADFLDQFYLNPRSEMLNEEPARLAGRIEGGGSPKPSACRDGCLVSPCASAFRRARDGTVRFSRVCPGDRRASPSPPASGSPYRGRPWSTDGGTPHRCVESRVRRRTARTPF